MSGYDTLFFGEGRGEASDWQSNFESSTSHRVLVNGSCAPHDVS